jgi:hypothetical protein
VVAQHPDPAHDPLERGPPSPVDAVHVRRLRAVDAHPDLEPVGTEQLAPLRVQQGRVRLDRVLNPARDPQVLEDQHPLLERRYGQGGGFAAVPDHPDRFVVVLLGDGGGGGFHHGGEDLVAALAAGQVAVVAVQVAKARGLEDHGPERPADPLIEPRLAGESAGVHDATVSPPMTVSR